MASPGVMAQRGCCRGFLLVFDSYKGTKEI
jgi:hypothetical protein